MLTVIAKYMNHFQIMTSIRKFFVVLLWAASLSLFTLSSSDAAREDIPLNEIREFGKILEHIRNSYVDDKDSSDLVRAGIRGMLRELDPYSVYLDKRGQEQLKERTEGKFGGLGIQVSYEKEENAVKVISPIDDTPAQKAGIEALDLIIKIDDRETKDIDLEQAVDLMRGEPGTSVTLTVRRQGAEENLTFTLVREEIKVPSVSLIPIRDRFVYTRISGFQQGTAADLARLLRSQNPQPLQGIVLDLRNNPGGLLKSAAGVSNLFVSEGVIVSTQGRSEKSKTVFKANPNDIAEKAQLVVLINGASASASEIVAGALQDHERALIVGMKSFGKGTVQSVLGVSPTAALKLTTARYRTPDGRFIDGIGIEPDILIDLPRRTENASITDEAMLAKEFSKEAQGIFSHDPQLWEAYKILERLTNGETIAAMKKGT